MGRDYPFLVFTVVSSETCLQDELTRLVLFFQAHATDFENWVVQGQMMIYYQPVGILSGLMMLKSAIDKLI